MNRNRLSGDCGLAGRLSENRPRHAAQRLALTARRPTDSCRCSDRWDFALRFLGAAIDLGGHALRPCFREELVIWIVGAIPFFVPVGTVFSTGRSIMRQKENPARRRLIRAPRTSLMGACGDRDGDEGGCRWPIPRTCRKQRTGLWTPPKPDVALAAMEGHGQGYVRQPRKPCGQRRGSGFSTRRILAETGWLRVLGCRSACRNHIHRIVGSTGPNRTAAPAAT